jgi:hypothetical protein
LKTHKITKEHKKTYETKQKNHKKTKNIDRWGRISRRTVPSAYPDASSEKNVILCQKKRQYT